MCMYIIAPMIFIITALINIECSFNDLLRENSTDTEVKHSRINKYRYEN